MFDENIFLYLYVKLLIFMLYYQIDIVGAGQRRLTIHSFNNGII